MLDDAGWQAWWQQESEAKARALYIHIPFCRKRCSFCNFFENGANPARMSRYMEALCGSLRQAAETPLVQSRPFSAVYVGAARQPTWRRAISPAWPASSAVFP